MQANRFSRSIGWDSNSSPIGNPKPCSIIGKSKVNTRSTYLIKNGNKEEVPASASPSTAQSNETRPPQDLYRLKIGSNLFRTAEDPLHYRSSEMPDGGNDEAENSRSSRNDSNRGASKIRSYFAKKRMNSHVNTINFSNNKSTDSGSFNLEGTDPNHVTSGSRSEKYSHCWTDTQQLLREKTVTEKQLQATILEQDEEMNKLRLMNSNYIQHIHELQEKTSDAEATTEKFTKVLKESNIIIDALTEYLKKKKSVRIDLLSWPITYQTKRNCDENNVIRKIEAVCDTVKSFDTKFNHQQQIIENKEAQIKSLNVELQDARDKWKDTEEHFNEKLLKQINILKRKEADLEGIKREHQKEIESLKETINKLNIELKHGEGAFKTLNNTLISKRKELTGANDEIMSLKQENSNLKQRLEQNIYQLKMLCEKKSDLDLQVYQTKEEIEKFKQKLSDEVEVSKTLNDKLISKEKELRVVNDPYKGIGCQSNSSNHSLSKTRENSPFNSTNSLNIKSTDSSTFIDMEQLQRKKTVMEKQPQDEEINKLREINSEHLEQISQLEAIIQHLRKLIEEGNAKLEVFANDLEKGKSPTWIAYLMRRFTYYGNKKKIEEYNIVGKTNSVGDTVKNIDTKFNHQQQKVEDQQSQTENLNVELEDAHDKCKRTEEKFVSHTKILNEKGDELEETKRERQKEIKSLKETINELNSEVNRAEDISKTLNDKLISKEKELRGANDKILSHKQENSNLEQKLEQKEYELERLREKKSDLDLQVQQMKDEVEKFKQKLNDVKVVVKKQVSILKKEEGKFKNNLEDISDKMKNLQKIVLLEDSAAQAVINNALEMIRKVKEDVENIEDQIHLFSGNSENKTFITLKEFLVRTISKLYGVESKGKEQILEARKECVTYVAALLIELESKVGK